MPFFICQIFNTGTIVSASHKNALSQRAGEANPKSLQEIPQTETGEESCALFKDPSRLQHGCGEISNQIAAHAFCTVARRRDYCVVFFLLMHENHFPPFNSFTGCGGQDTAETIRYDGTRPGRPAPAELTGESIWALRGIFTLF